MKKFLRKYYQEMIAVMLVVGFWSGIWAYHAFQATQVDNSVQQTAIPYDPALTNK